MTLEDPVLDVDFLDAVEAEADGRVAIDLAMYERLCAGVARAAEQLGLTTVGRAVVTRAVWSSLDERLVQNGVAKALAEPERRVLRYLTRRPRTVAQVAIEMGCAHNTADKLLHGLRERGIVAYSNATRGPYLWSLVVEGDLARIDALLSRVSSVSVTDLVEIFGISEGHALMQLVSGVRQGHLIRIPGGRYARAEPVNE